MYDSLKNQNPFRLCSHWLCSWGRRKLSSETLIFFQSLPRTWLVSRFWNGLPSPWAHIWGERQFWSCSRPNRGSGSLRSMFHRQDSISSICSLGGCPGTNLFFLRPDFREKNEKMGLGPKIEARDSLFFFASIYLTPPFRFYSLPIVWSVFQIMCCHWSTWLQTIRPLPNKPAHSHSLHSIWEGFKAQFIWVCERGF